MIQRIGRPSSRYKLKPGPGQTLIIATAVNTGDISGFWLCSTGTGAVFRAGGDYQAVMEFSARYRASIAGSTSNSLQVKWGMNSLPVIASVNNMEDSCADPSDRLTISGIAPLLTTDDGPTVNVEVDFSGGNFRTVCQQDSELAWLILIEGELLAVDLSEFTGNNPIRYNVIEG